MSAKTVINFRIDEEIKQQAKAVAKELGVSLSTIINSQLRQLIRTHSLEINSRAESTSQIEDILSEIEVNRDRARPNRGLYSTASPLSGDRLRFGYVQYTPELASYWDSFIDWDKRRKGEGDFFIDQLKRHDTQTVLDFACGTGYDTIRLLEAGFKVKSSDGSLFMLTKARINAEDLGHHIDASFCDWRRLRRNFRNKFDAAVCLGNSFCHLFETQDRLDVLKQVASLLPNGGVFIVDQRNFDRILDKGYSSRHKYVYCGDQVDIGVQNKNENYLKLLYDTGAYQFNMEVYPIRQKELRSLLHEAGFEVISYGDFKQNFNRYDPDFIQHVCVKRY